MKQFVKAIEVWVPSSKNNLVLELGSAYYGELSDFKHRSETMSFAYDQGLPGKTWATGRPIVLTDLSNDYFQRSEIAEQAYIDCGISLPIFSGDFLQAVVVLFCGGGENVVGATEIWHNADGNENELKLVDGYYGELENFEWISRRLTIMRGRGLPGKAWDAGKPIIIDDISLSNSFMRANHAAEVGITTGLAIPFSYPESEVQILTLLSAKGTPIARRFEIWVPNEDCTALHFDSGHCYVETDLALKYANRGISKGEGPIGESWLSGRPLVADISPNEGDAMIVLPNIKDCRLNSIVCLVL